MLPGRLLPVSVNVFKFNGSDKSSPYEVMLTADVNVSVPLPGMTQIIVQQAKEQIEMRVIYLESEGLEKNF